MNRDIPMDAPKRIPWWNPFAAARIALARLSAKFRPIPMEKADFARHRQDHGADIAPSFTTIDTPYSDSPSFDCSDSGGACGD